MLYHSTWYLPLNAAPSWIVNFVEKENDKKLRKKIDFSDSDSFFFDSAKSASKEYSKKLAEINAVKKIKAFISQKMNQKDTNIASLNILATVYFTGYDFK